MSSAQGSIRQQVRVIVTSSSPPASISKRCGIQRTLADGSFVCSSRQALKKYVQANNNLSGVTDAQFSTQFNRALQRGSDAGAFARPKGTSLPTIALTDALSRGVTDGTVRCTSLLSTSLLLSSLHHGPTVGCHADPAAVNRSVWPSEACSSDQGRRACCTQACCHEGT